MAAISYEYKTGVKREIVSALRKVLGDSYPDPALAGKIQVSSEYPQGEISYPLVSVRFNPGEIQNIGIGHYETAINNDGIPEKVLHWRFQGTLTLTVYALSPVDRDMVITGLINLLAFGTEIPGFSLFRQEINDYDYVSLTIMGDSIQEAGDSVVNPPWDANNEVIFTDSITVPVFGEFFTQPTTGGLVQISGVSLYPYRYDQPVPVGSQAHNDIGDDRTVGWVP